MRQCWFVLSFQQASKAAITHVSSACSLPAEPDGCEDGCKAPEEKAEARKERQEKKSSVTEQSGEIIVEEVDGGTTSTDLSGWQVIGLSTPPLSGGQSQNYLTVDDRDSTVSDTESLARCVAHQTLYLPSCLPFISLVSLLTSVWCARKNRMHIVFIVFPDCIQ